MSIDNPFENTNSKLSFFKKKILSLTNTSFVLDPVEEEHNLPYYCGSKFESTEGLAHVYDCAGVGSNSFTKAQLMSIHLANIVSQYGIPRECHRDLVKFINTLIRDFDKFMEGNAATHVKKKCTYRII